MSTAIVLLRDSIKWRERELSSCAKHILGNGDELAAIYHRLFEVRAQLFEMADDNSSIDRICLRIQAIQTSQMMVTVNQQKSALYGLVVEMLSKRSIMGRERTANNQNSRRQRDDPQ